jgi:hypothetical protein
LSLGAGHYLTVWRLRPDLRELLLDLGRMWKASGKLEDANAALLAASRGADPRVADRAKEIGRMISEERLTPEALKHAEQLLKLGTGR